MTESYCGKNCAECTDRKILHCPGCKGGPGRQYGGDCELANCCREKGHESCDTCSFQINCGKLRRKDKQLEYRKQKMEEEMLWKQTITRRAPILGKWLWILFWLVASATVIGLLENDLISREAPIVYLMVQIFSVVCSFAYGIILIKISSEEEHYRTSGICAFVCAGINLLLLLLFRDSDTAIWTLILTIPSTIVGLIGEYNEYVAHSIVLTNVNNVLASKWETLWKWYIGLSLGIIGSIILLLIIPVLGSFAVIVTVVGTSVVGIIKIVYLYQTAKVFRRYHSNKPSFLE